MSPQKPKYQFILDLLRQLNEGASLKVKAPGFELSAGGVVGILAAIILISFFLK